MNGPNLLTLLRILLTFVFIYFISLDGFGPKMIALLVFFIASATDYFDGYLAKKLKQITDFGKIMDPIADKFLILSAFYIFTRDHIIAFWMFATIGFREIFITGLRLYAMRRGVVRAAEKAGKYKTVTQLGAIVLILIFIMVREPDALIACSAPCLAFLQQTILVVMYLAVAITIFSGLFYLWNNKSLLTIRD